MTHLKKSASVAAAVAALGGAAIFGTALFRGASFAMAEQRVEIARQDLSGIDQESKVFREIDEVVGPSVVCIHVIKTVPHQATQIPPEFRQFFHNFGNMAPESGDGQDQPEAREEGTGSGVIMDVADGYGYILTNNHVAGGASDMAVTLADGRVIRDAQLVAADPKTDLAVVKIKADHLIAAKWGNSSDLEPGDAVLAFGSPFGYVGSMTHGIVSALHRQAGILGQDGYENFIQVDAPINPGNSGGPLVNLHGEVVGINTAIASSSGGFQGIGFAIPADEAQRVYGELKGGGHVVRGWLGVSIENVSQVPDEAQSEGYNSTSGVLVHAVLKDGPAAGSLQAGDIVTTLNGKPVATVTELRDEIAWSAPGSDVRLGVFRDGKNIDVNVKLAEAGAQLASETTTAAPSAQTPSDLGMRLGNVDDQQAQEFNLSEKSGAVVLEVDPNSTAGRAGLQAGDVITRINGHAVTSADQAARDLSKGDVKTGIRLEVTNSQGTELLFIKGDVG